MKAVKDTAARIRQQDNLDAAEKARRIAVTDNWESKNLGMLCKEKDKVEHASVVTRKAAGAKVKKLLDFVNMRGLCALNMMSNLTLWQQLDAGARAAKAVADAGTHASVAPRSLAPDMNQEEPATDTQRMLRQSSKFDEDHECPTPARASVGAEAPDAAAHPPVPLAEADTQVCPEPQE